MQYQVNIADLDRDAADITHLWAQGLSENTDHNDKLNWFHRMNPAGQGRVFLLRDERSDETVGTNGIGVRCWSVGGRAQDVGIFVNFVVSIHHRTLGPSLILLKRSVGESGIGGFLYGFPNIRAFPVFKRAGYELCGNIFRFSRVLRSRQYLADRLPRRWMGYLLAPLLDLWIRVVYGPSLRRRGLRTSWLNDFDERFDWLWNNVEVSRLMLCRRDRDFLRWRFIEQPNANYRIFTVQEATENLYGYVVCKMCNNVVEVADFLARGGNHGLRLLLENFLREIYAEGHAGVSVDFFGDEDVAHVLQTLGFRAREGRPLISHMSPEMKANARELSWYVTAADEDI